MEDIELLKSAKEQGKLEDVERLLEGGKQPSHGESRSRHSHAREPGHATPAGQANAVSKDTDSRVPDNRSYVEKLVAIQQLAPREASTAGVVLPPGGSRTAESALRDTRRTRRVAQDEGMRSVVTARRVRGPVGEELECEFRDMVKGDYSGRCQICGSTFAKHDNERQMFIVHLVKPTDDDMANHLGNLLGLCGWHYALIEYGDWSFGFEGSQPPESPEQLLELVGKVHGQYDDSGNDYMGLPICFHNVYNDWNPEPGDVHATVRYSKPHWEYLQALLEDRGV